MDFQSFINYCNKHIKGDEKGEAQIFLDHFFVALGYEDGLKATGGGNFLFIAYKEIKLLEKEILKRLKTISHNKDYWYYSINCAYVAQLLALNLQFAQNENEGKPVQPPGLPGFVKNKEQYVSDDRVRFEWE